MTIWAIYDIAVGSLIFMVPLMKPLTEATPRKTYVNTATAVVMSPVTLPAVVPADKILF